MRTVLFYHSRNTASERERERDGCRSLFLSQCSHH